MEHLKRETALSLRPGKIARAWLRLLVVVVCRIPRGQWRTGRLRRLPRSRDSATLVPGILFGKQATMSITKNDKNTRTTGRPTLNEVARRAGSARSPRRARCAASPASPKNWRRRSATPPANSATWPTRGARAGLGAKPQRGGAGAVAGQPAVHRDPRGDPRGTAAAGPGSADRQLPLLAQRGRGPDPQLPGLPAARPAADRLRAHRERPADDRGQRHSLRVHDGPGLRRRAQLRRLLPVARRRGAAEHLLARGRRRLAYIGAQLDQRTLLRGEGFRRALQKPAATTRGWKSTPRPSSVALGGELFVQLLASQPQVDGVFFCNDDLAQGALLEALRRGVKVPEQIAVLGFNDLPGSDCTVPRLSSIRTPREAIGGGARRSSCWR